MNFPGNNLQDVSGISRFTDNAKRMVVMGYEIAQRHNNVDFLPIHVFLALLESPTQLILRIYDRVGLDPKLTKEQLEMEIDKLSVVGVSEPRFSEKIKLLVNNAFLQAERLSHVYVGSEHLLLALLDMQEEDFVRELHQLGLTVNSVTDVMNNVGSYWPGVLSQSKQMQGDGMFGDAGGTLPYFCRNMNEQVERGEFLEITGRENEIERLIHILARKTKNNPILVGDAGVGKTAVVQGLVQRIAREEVPTSFIDKTVLSIDIPAILAGAKIRGDLEERIIGLVNDAIQADDKILFIDEIHMIVGAGSFGARDSMDIGNILKPYLTDPRLRIIGATTSTEYRRYFDDDPALSRRFQPIDIEEIDKESALEIMKNLKPEFEKYHGVKISQSALEAAVNLSDQFISDRYLPDKAIDLIDEAAASVKIGMEIQIEPALSELGSKLLKMQQKKEEAISSNDLTKALEHKHKEDEIAAEITDLIEGRHKKSARGKSVDSGLVERVVVNWTKIPLAAATLDTRKLNRLNSVIKRHIVGQDHILDRVVDTLKRTHVGLADPKRPLASFLFLGPTGVGKSELAKVIARELFGSEDLLVQINMSEYMEMHSVSKLIGSPPGYVGYQEGGQLTEQIRRRPYSVVLFDEVEKAHPEVLNVLLQVLEEGELQDGRGRKANFRNTVVILTSNIGAEDVARDRRLGFDVSTDEVKTGDMDRAFTDMREKILEKLRNTVRPEILNRLDDVLVFRGFNKEDCLEISRLQVYRLINRLLERNIALNVPLSIIKYVNEEGYSKEYGARNIRRKVQEVLENALTNYLLEHKLKPSRRGVIKLSAKLEGNKVAFSQSK